MMLFKSSKPVIFGLALSLGAFLFLNAPCTFAQGEQAASQTVFQDDADLLRLDNAQINQLQMQEQSAEQQAALDNQRNQAYRLYAEKRVQELEKLKTPANQQQIVALQKWLQADANMRQRDMQIIRALQARIARLEQTQSQTTAQLGNDVGAIREAGQDAHDAEKFKQMMAINYFNELQTEMGPASWYPPKGGGGYYSMGGMGFNGGQQLFGGY